MKYSGFVPSSMISPFCYNFLFFIKFRVRFSSRLALTCWEGRVGSFCMCVSVFVLIHDFLHYYTTNIKRTTLFALCFDDHQRESVCLCFCGTLREVETNRFSLLIKLLPCLISCAWHFRSRCPPFFLFCILF